MNKITLLLLNIIGCILIFSCHHAKDSSHKNLSESALKSNQNNWLGNWDRHKWQNGGELVISKVIRDSIVFHLEVNGGGATGELEGEAHIRGDSAVFMSTENGGSCRMVFQLKKHKSAISIKSTGCNGYVGLNAYFEGDYTCFKGREDSWDNDTTQTLVSLQVLNKKENSVFRKLVGRYYRTYLDNTQQIEEDLEDQDKLNTKIVASWVNQMRTQMEYIVMIDSSKHIWTAVIDNDTIRYFTNSNLFKNHLPKTIDNWRDRFKGYPVVYHNK